MFLRPKSLEEAAAVLARDGGTLLAGGTDLFPAWVDRPQPERLVRKIDISVKG